VRKISILVAIAVLTLQNSGARANAPGPLDLFTLPHPALAATLTLAGMACLLLLAPTPLIGAPHPLKPRSKSWIWRDQPNFWPSRRATLAIFAMVTVGGALGMA
jgi:hypothetical protein